MTAGSGIRIGDAERNAMAESLREHYAAGRLTMEEFQERLDAAFAAKTDADLGKLSEDLPHTRTYSPYTPQHAGPVQPYQPAAGRAGSPGPGARVFAMVSGAISFLVLATLVILWLPFGGLPKTILLVLAVFAFIRRIFRRVIVGGRRRG